MERNSILNLNPGPSSLPLPVLEEAARGLLNFNGTGMGITEISHRSKEFQALTNDLVARIRALLSVPDTHEILFTQGGASLVFSTIALNLLARFRLLHPNLPLSEVSADYVVTGVWSKKAYEEAKRLVQHTGVNVRIAADGRTESEDGKSFQSVPSKDKYQFGPAEKTAWIYYCENETVNGVQFASAPEDPAAFPLDAALGPPQHTTIDPPLVADFSSSFLSRPIPQIERHALIYGGAQKNIGPAGLTIIIVRKDLLVDVDAAHTLGGCPPCPLTLSFQTLAESGSLYNTPPMFSMYVSDLVLKDLQAKGGLSVVEENNRQKQQVVYGVLEKMEEAGIIQLNVKPGSRSWMNVTFIFHDPALGARFVKEAEAKGLRGVKGHRSVGGFRLSLYNAITLENARTVAGFLEEFLASTKDD